VTTFNLEHVAASNNKLRVTSFTGSCPTCGLSPTTSFTYGGSNPHLPSATTDAKGTRTDYTYTVDGRRQTQVEAANVPALTRTTTYSYDANFPGLVTRVEVPSTSGGSNKRRTDAAYDATSGVMTSRTTDGFEGGAALGSGEPLSIDPPGFGTTDARSFTYNLTGRNGHVADTRTDPLLGTTTFGYDGLNRRISVTDVNGVQTLTAYDTLNRVVELRKQGEIADDDLVTTFIYNGFGDLFCTRLPRGNGIEYSYDGVGHLTAVARGTVVATPSSTSCLDPAEARERIAYQLDGTGQRTEESRERWSGSAWVSDSKTSHVFTCQLDKTTQGAGSATPSVTEFCYDLNQNLEKVWDANHPKASHPNPTILYEYDELNRLKKLTSGVGAANAAPTTYAYDVQDHLASVIDAEGNQTTYTTSDRDLLTQQVSPVSGTTSYAYNEHGRLDKTTDARGIVADPTVDAADRVTQQTFGPPGSPNAALTTTYTYGSTPAQFDVGRLIGITRDTDALTYAYDRFGRLVQDGGLAYEYDKNGYRTAITYSETPLIANYVPDFSDRDAALSYDEGSGPQPVVTDAAYGAFGPLTSLTFGNGMVETRTFDARYFPGRIQAGSLMDWNYTVDALGNPTSITGSLAGSSYSASFTYEDNRYFLTGADGPWGSRAWTYDRSGNRLTASGTGLPTSTYAYSGTGHNPRLQSVTPDSHDPAWAYAYDASGNQTTISPMPSGSGDTSYYETGADGRLAAFGTVEGARTDATYDGRGFLRQANLSPAFGDPVDVVPVYESSGTLLSTTTTQHPVLATPIAQVTTTSFLYFAGRPVALFSGSDRQFLSTDPLGTPVVGTKAASGSLVSRNVGEPFTSGEDKSQVIHYPGQWSSEVFATTGTQGELYYNLHRWYEPQTGRYIEPDPVRTEQALRPYGYANDDPVREIDPLGLVWSAADCDSCCTPADSARELQQIRNFMHANGRSYRKRGHPISYGCGQAADAAGSDVEHAVRPKCWITRSQLLAPYHIAVLETYVVVHFVPTFRPCGGHGAPQDDLEADPYNGDDELRPARTEWWVDDLFCPAPPPPGNHPIVSW
jgi:RHS repeat-associated protein